MKIIFFGTSIFAVPSLKALAGSGHKILLAVTQPDRKKGRNLKLMPPPIKEIASGLDISVYQPQDASSGDSVDKLRRLGADLFVVVAFGQILSEELLGLPKKFSVNLHGSILPKYRGAAPINRAVINGDKKTGVSVFRLVKEMDAGDVILDKEVDIRDDDNAITLSDRLSHVGADILLRAVDLIEKDAAAFKKQDNAFVTFAPKLKKEDGLINWENNSFSIHNRVRALLPWPAAFTYFNGKMLRILETRVSSFDDNKIKCGEIIEVSAEKGILVKTEKSCLSIKRLQLEASRPMSAEEFARGHKIRPGDRLGR